MTADREADRLLASILRFVDCLVRQESAPRTPHGCLSTSEAGARGGTVSVGTQPRGDTKSCATSGVTAACRRPRSREPLPLRQREQDRAAVPLSGERGSGLVRAAYRRGSAQMHGSQQSRWATPSLPLAGESGSPYADAPGAARLASRVDATAEMSSRSTIWPPFR
jgi:hypothetical protein